MFKGEWQERVENDKEIQPQEWFRKGIPFASSLAVIQSGGLCPDYSTVATETKSSKTTKTVHGGRGGFSLHADNDGLWG